MWAALARAATEELQQQQFTALSDREALAVLQGRKLGVARLRLLPKRAGEAGGGRPTPEDAAAAAGLPDPGALMPGHPDCRHALYCQPRPPLHRALPWAQAAPGWVAPAQGPTYSWRF